MITQYQDYNYYRYEVQDFMIRFSQHFNEYVGLFVNDCTHRNHKKGLNDLEKRLFYHRIGGGKNCITLIELHCGFDIETTKINDNLTFCYGWQFSINNIVVWGHRLDEVVTLFDFLETQLKTSKSTRLIVWVANLGYEWQFIKKYLNVTKSFLKEEREPVEITHNDFIILKECLSWGGSLEKLAKDYTPLRKLKGDLDYSIYRESYDEFTSEQEWRYIDFDVLILSEFGKWYFKTYVIGNKTKPVTIQSAIRNNLYNASTDEERARVQNCFLKDYRDYLTLVNNVYRGGYTHASKMIIGENVRGLWSYDFTSSYPSVMLCEKYPYKFTRVIDKKKWNEKYIISNTTDNAYIIHCIFTNIKSTTNHSIESKSKALNKITPDNKTIIDNGRICACPVLDVWLTEQDFLTYKEFYKWDNMKILDLWSSKKDYLPRYIIDELTRLYIAKDTLKKNKKNYALEKSYLNSTYGVCVARLVVDEIQLDSDNNAYSEIKTLSEEEKEQRIKEVYEHDIGNPKKVLLPQWGVYISAYARRNLLSTLYRLETTGNPVAYMDTDSIKFQDLNNGKSIIEEYNAKQQSKIKKMCTKYNLDFNIFYDLGAFDCEYENGIKLFKTLGAKRYLHVYEEDEILHYQCTVAGLPKKDYISRYKPENDKDYISYFEPFKDSLTIEKTSKLTSCYEDEPQQFTGRTYYKNQTLYVPSCVTLNDCSFSMSLDTNWCNYLITLGISKFAQRNYG